MLIGKQVGVLNTSVSERGCRPMIIIRRRQLNIVVVPLLTHALLPAETSAVCGWLTVLCLAEL